MKLATKQTQYKEKLLEYDGIDDWEPRRKKREREQGVRRKCTLRCGMRCEYAFSMRKENMTKHNTCR